MKQSLMPLFLVFVSGCALLPDASSGCDEPKPYQAAQENPPLRVPQGSVAPDTRNAMRIPPVAAPQVPVEEDRCLDQPPSYGATARAGS